MNKKNNNAKPKFNFLDVIIIVVEDSAVDFIFGIFNRHDIS